MMKVKGLFKTGESGWTHKEVRGDLVTAGSTSARIMVGVGDITADYEPNELGIQEGDHWYPSRRLQYLIKI